MAKGYYQGKFGITSLLANKQISLEDSEVLLNLDNLSDLFLEHNDNKLPKSIYQFKCTDLNIIMSTKSILEKKYEIIKEQDGSCYDFKLDNKTLRLYKTGGRLQNITDENGNST
jgi:hypothetical protein